MSPWETKLRECPVEGRERARRYLRELMRSTVSAVFREEQKKRVGLDYPLAFCQYKGLRENLTGT